MKRSLRKGPSSVYFQYSNDCDGVNADTFEVEIIKDTLIFRFCLKPVDSNQTDDENDLHELELQSVMIDDEYIVDNFSNLFKHNAASSMKLEIDSKGNMLSYNVTPEIDEIGKLNLIINL